MSESEADDSGPAGEHGGGQVDGIGDRDRAMISIETNRIRSIHRHGSPVVSG